MTKVLFGGPNTELQWRKSTELWLVEGELVATQQDYCIPSLKETSYEVKHFCCIICGEVWGKRINPLASSPLHRFEKRKCKECGGKADMLMPWEWNNLHILSEGVLAYTLLNYTTDPKEDHHENCKAEKTGS